MLGQVLNRGPALRAKRCKATQLMRTKAQWRFSEGSTGGRFNMATVPVCRVVHRQLHQHRHQAVVLVRRAGVCLLRLNWRGGVPINGRSIID